MTSKRSDNILPKYPPVLRVSSTQEGLSEIASDGLVRGKNSSDAMASEGRMSFAFLLLSLFTDCLDITILLNILPFEDVRDILFPMSQFL